MSSEFGVRAPVGEIGGRDRSPVQRRSVGVSARYAVGLASPGRVAVAAERERCRRSPDRDDGRADRGQTRRSQPGVPVVAALGPVVGRALVGVADHADPLEALDAVLVRRGEPQRRTVTWVSGSVPWRRASIVCGCIADAMSQPT